MPHCHCGDKDGKHGQHGGYRYGKARSSGKVKKGGSKSKTLKSSKIGGKRRRKTTKRHTKRHTKTHRRKR